MSWSVTVHDLSTVEELPQQILDKIGWDNRKYIHDAIMAFSVAKACGLDSAALSGGRTPSPDGRPDHVAISIVGFDQPEGNQVRARDFNMAVLDNIFTGPDNDPNSDGLDNERQETDVPLSGRHRQK